MFRRLDQSDIDSILLSCDEALAKYFACLRKNFS